MCQLLQFIQSMTDIYINNDKSTNKQVSQLKLFIDTKYNAH